MAVLKRGQRALEDTDCRGPSGASDSAGPGWAGELASLRSPQGMLVLPAGDPTRRTSAVEQALTAFHPATGTRRTADGNVVHTLPLGSSGTGGKGRLLGRRLPGLTLGPLGPAVMADPGEAAAALRGWPPGAPLRGGEGSELPAAGL